MRKNTHFTLGQTLGVLALLFASAPTTTASASATAMQGECVPPEATAVGSQVRCIGDDVTFTVDVTAGTAPITFTWTHGGILISETSNTLYIPSITLEDRGVYCVTASNACGEVTFCARLTVTQCNNEFCTLTQGAYGNAGGQWNGLPRLQLITNLLSSGDLVLGVPGRSVTIQPGVASANCIIARLPAGGPAAVLPNFGNQILNTGTCQTASPLPLQSGRFRNILLGQTLTLSLNVRLDPNLLGLAVCHSMTTGVLGAPNDVLTVTVPQSVINGLGSLGYGHNVAGLLQLANDALGGIATPGLTLSDINAAVDAVNKGFDECRILTDCQ